MQRRWKTPPSRSSRRNLLGDRVEVLCVKRQRLGTLDSIEPQGFSRRSSWPGFAGCGKPGEALRRGDGQPAAHAPVRRTAQPNPSVETLLHAFLPHTFIDQHPCGRDPGVGPTSRMARSWCARRIGDRVVVGALCHARVPAGQAGSGDVSNEKRDADGMVLLKHGLFTFAPDARGRATSATSST